MFIVFLLEVSQADSNSRKIVDQDGIVSGLILREMRNYIRNKQSIRNLNPKEQDNIWGFMRTFFFQEYCQKFTDCIFFNEFTDCKMGHCPQHRKNLRWESMD